MELWNFDLTKAFDCFQLCTIFWHLGPHRPFLGKLAVQPITMKPMKKNWDWLQATFHFDILIAFAVKASCRNHTLTYWISELMCTNMQVLPSYSSL
jgi:hypothetical protein